MHKYAFTAPLKPLQLFFFHLLWKCSHTWITKKITFWAKIQSLENGFKSYRFINVCDNMGPISDWEKCVERVQQVTDSDTCVGAWRWQRVERCWKYWFSGSESHIQNLRIWELILRFWESTQNLRILRIDLYLLRIQIILRIDLYLWKYFFNLLIKYCDSVPSTLPSQNLGGSDSCANVFKTNP